MTSPPLAALPEIARRRPTVAGLDFEVQLSGARRSIGITVDRDGSLIVNAPQDCDEAELAARSREADVGLQEARREGPPPLASPDEGVRQRRGLRVPRPFASTAPRQRRDDAVKLERGRLVMRRDVATDEVRRQAIVDWYRKSGAAVAPAPRGAVGSPHGRESVRIDVRDLGYRWGSLGKGYRVNFHWATIQLAPTLVDYVIVHELAHIHEPHHTPDFWIRVERALPTFLPRDKAACAGSDPGWVNLALVPVPEQLSAENPWQ